MPRMPGEMYSGCSESNVCEGHSQFAEKRISNLKVEIDVVGYANNECEGSKKFKKS